MFISRRQIPKIGNLGSAHSRGARAASFSFSVNHRDLKNEYFCEKLQIPSFYYKESLKLKLFFTFNSPLNGQN